MLQVTERSTTTPRASGQSNCSTSPLVWSRNTDNSRSGNDFCPLVRSNVHFIEGSSFQQPTLLLLIWTSCNHCNQLEHAFLELTAKKSWQSTHSVRSSGKKRPSKNRCEMRVNACLDARVLFRRTITVFQSENSILWPIELPNFSAGMISQYWKPEEWQPILSSCTLKCAFYWRLKFSTTNFASSDMNIMQPLSLAGPCISRANCKEITTIDPQREEFW